MLSLLFFHLVSNRQVVCVCVCMCARVCVCVYVWCVCVYMWCVCIWDVCESEMWVSMKGECTSYFTNTHTHTSHITHITHITHHAHHTHHTSHITHHTSHTPFTVCVCLLDTCFIRITMFSISFFISSSRCVYVVCMYVCACVYVCLCVYVLCMRLAHTSHTYIHTYIHTCFSSASLIALSSSKAACLAFANEICVYVCVWCMRVCAYVCVLCVCVCVCVQIT